MTKLGVVLIIYIVLIKETVWSGKNVVCYFGSWANYRAGLGKFTVNDIDPTLCTHLNYAFFGLNIDGTVAILDSWLDLPSGLNFIQQFNNLKQKNPGLKTLAAIGGWNLGSTQFSTVAKSATLRSKFAVQARQFCQTYGFDGIDIDWEYPAQREGSDASVDKANFVLMLGELNTELKKFGLLLTVAVAASASSASISYDIPGVSENVDYINLMEYDFHGSYDGVTGENAPLTAGPADVTPQQKELNVMNSVEYWLSEGAPASKLNLGMPLYGRTFTLTNANVNGVGKPTSGAGQAGPYTAEAGFLGYNEICEKLSAGGWTQVWYDAQKVPYAYSGNQWIGYDNDKSFLAKCDVVNSYGLAGGMLWSIETDDFLGKCGRKFELTATLKDCLASTSTATTAKPSTTTATTTKTTTKTSTTTAKTPTTVTTTKASATTTKSSSTGPFVCTTTGYFRDPVDCSKYYYCSGTTQYAFSCPAGLYFSPPILACDWPANFMEINKPYLHHYLFSLMFYYEIIQLRLSSLQAQSPSPQRIPKVPTSSDQGWS
ncbi:acidic mammalian chitinase-like [Sabethes cyaneus]|uniref:acidic mammalian chitinase-like n=1 Tax=Sabethes cyaneus TaxID=53552 RepID=UPI00237E22DD|nr:acidic mammalian chitinase-like [Sabethes cyaneus]